MPPASGVRSPCLFRMSFYTFPAIQRHKGRPDMMIPHGATKSSEGSGLVLDFVRVQ